MNVRLACWIACFVFLTSPCLGAELGPDAPRPFGVIRCEKSYPRHLQGVCTNQKDTIYWSFTTELVKTDLEGKVQREIEVPTHHGDLCYHDGRVYVAVNLGKFNRPAGEADSWVFVYDAESLAELARHPVPDVVHGAGGMTWRDGRFYIVGGLPDGVPENYIYEYDDRFVLQKRHVLPSGTTYKGIQAVTFAAGKWWFGCYGRPKSVLLTADPDFTNIQRFENSACYGIEPLGDDRLLVARNRHKTDEHVHEAWLVVAQPDPEEGLRFEETPRRKK